MALKIFCLSVLTIIMYAVITTSQPITSHAVRRNVLWSSEAGRWSWPSSSEYHLPRHSHSDDYHHEHNENCGHTLVYHMPSHRHSHYSGHSVDYHRHHPQVYPPLAPIYDLNALPTKAKITTTISTSDANDITTTTIKPTLVPAPIYEEVDEESNDDKQTPQFFSTTVENIPITDFNPGVELPTTLRTSSGIDLRFGS